MPPSVPAFDIRLTLSVALTCVWVFLTGREIARWEGTILDEVGHVADVAQH